jgi:hypothetical protein
VYQCKKQITQSIRDHPTSHESTVAQCSFNTYEAQYFQLQDLCSCSQAWKRRWYCNLYQRIGPALLLNLFLKVSRTRICKPCLLCKLHLPTRTAEHVYVRVSVLRARLSQVFAAQADFCQFSATQRVKSGCKGRENESFLWSSDPGSTYFTRKYIISRSGLRFELLSLCCVLLLSSLVY